MTRDDATLIVDVYGEAKMEPVEVNETALVRRVAELSVDTAFDVVINTLGLIAEAKQRLTELQKETEDTAVAILKRDGRQTIGTVSYWAGVSKTTKCKSLKDAAEMIFQASEGDWDKFVNCLSANAIKHGAAKKLFIEAKTPEKFAAVFEVKEKAKLEDDEPKEALQSADSDFIR